MNASSKGDNVRERLRRFHAEQLRQSEAEFRSLVERGQDPHALFIACSDSRVAPHLLVGAEPGDLTSHPKMRRNSCTRATSVNTLGLGIVLREFRWVFDHPILPVIPYAIWRRKETTKA